MTRIQVLLSDTQNEKLGYLANKLKTNKSRLIREAVDLLLTAKVTKESDPLLNLIGQAGAAGRSDLSRKHDEFLLKEGHSPFWINTGIIHSAL